MTFFHGDKNSATSGADFSSSSQGALDSRAVIGDLHNPGREKNRIVRGSWPQHFDGKGWENKFGLQYGIFSIPTTWLVDKLGNLRVTEASRDLEGQIEFPQYLNAAQEFGPQ